MKKQIIIASEFAKVFWLAAETLPLEAQSMYHIYGVFSYSNDLEIERLKNALQMTVNTNYNLRSNFVFDQNQLKQIIYDRRDVNFTVYQTNSDNESQQIIDQVAHQPFDLTSDQLYRFVLIKNRSNQTYTFFTCFHHIILDGATSDKLCMEAEDNYRNPKPLDLSDNDAVAKLQEYLDWEKKQIQKTDLKQLIAKFKDYPLITNLPYRSSKAADLKQKVVAYEAKLNGEIYLKLKELSSRTGHSVFNILKTSWATLIAKYCNQEKIIVNYSFNTRRARFRDLKGSFVNAQLYTEDLNLSLFESLDYVKKNFHKNYSEMFIPIGSILHELPGSSLTDVSIVYAYFSPYVPKFTEECSEVRSPQISGAKIILKYYESNDALYYQILALEELFEPSLIKNALSHLENILFHLVNGYSGKLKDIQMLTEQEYQKIVYGYNQTDQEYPKDKTISQLFEEQVEKTPNDVAVVFEDNVLTYQELNHRANQLARYLRQQYQQVQKVELEHDTLITLLFDSSHEMAVAILAVLKAGGAYVPIDPNYSSEQIGYLLTDTKTNLVITQKHLESRLPTNQPSKIVTDHQETYLKLQKVSKDNLGPNSKANSLAFVVYVTETTENPRGVMFEHAGIINRIQWMQNKSQLHSSAKVLHKTPNIFDASVWELLWANIGGQTSSPSQIKLLNLCGFDTGSDGDETAGLIPIGKPIVNTRCYILNSSMSPVPTGIIGELYLGGASLARGYLNQPELTAKSFIENPFATAPDPTNCYVKLYKTGGLARWRSDGNIEYFGCGDFKVKIRELNYVAPQSDAEKILVGIWQQVLGIEKVGINDNFFNLGGHSLTAIKLVNLIAHRFKVAISVKSIFEHSTIASFCREVLAFAKENYFDWPQITADAENIYQEFPLTEVQQAYLFGRESAFDLGGVSTHGYSEYELKSLNIEKLEDTLNQLIDRHLMLRSVFLKNGLQKFLETVDRYKITTQDLSKLSESERNDHLQRWRNEMSHQVFIPYQWPLYDVRVSILPDRFRLHISLDILIFDGFSVGLLFSEWSNLYKDPHLKLPKLDITFRDYMLTYDRLKQTDRYQRDKEYWAARISHLPFGPELPLVVQPSSIKKPIFKRCIKEIDERSWRAFKAQCIKNNLTSTAAILAIYSAVLARWSKNNLFLINLTLFNRLPLHEQVNEIVGDFTTLELFEADLNNISRMSFIESAQACQKLLLEDLEHRLFTGIDVQREMRKVNQSGSSIISPVVLTSTLSFEEGLNEELLFDGFCGNPYSITQTSQVWLDNVASEKRKKFIAQWDYIEDLFPRGLVESMHDAYCRLIEHFALVSWDEQLPELVDESALNLINAANASVGEVPNILMHEAFFNQVKQHSNRIAVKSAAGSLTYQELYEQSNRVAHCLKQLKVKPNQLIGIVMEKGKEEVIGCLGILGSGAAYLPVNSDWPVERIDTVLKLGKVKIVLTQKGFYSKLKEQGFNKNKKYRCLCIDDAKIWEKYPITQLPLQQSSNDIAYVIFTSGSTGQPKGVVISHRNAMNTIVDINHRFKVTNKDRVFALSNLSFDLSVYDIFGLLAAGGTIVMPAKDQYKLPEAWVKWLIQEKITLWNTVPMLMNMLVEYLSTQPAELVAKLRQTLKLVLMSGDWIPLELPNQIKNYFTQANVISLGGATEGSIWSICYPIDKVDANWKSIPYGKALCNQKMYVLNDALELCPIHVPGIIYIGGEGVAQSYWSDSEKTAASFIIHPVTKERLYKTGDFGKLLADGNIEFLGREDFQVKVGGHRVELGEIESVIKSLPEIKDVVVDVVGKQFQNKKLVAYVVPDLGEKEVLTLTEKLAFKQSRHGLRKEKLTNEIIKLSKEDLGNEVITRYFSRKSYRRFIDAAVTAESILTVINKETNYSEKNNCKLFEDIFGYWLSELASYHEDGLLLPKYYYPSAGSTYPVQTYICINKNFGNLKKGSYYYHPDHHSLIKLEGEFKSNLTKNEVTVHLVSNLAAITPLYGELSKIFCELEVGYMAALLKRSATQLNLELLEVNEDNDFINTFGLAKDYVYHLGFGVSNKRQNNHHDNINLVDQKINTYVFIKPNRVDGLVGGVYKLVANKLILTDRWEASYEDFNQFGSTGSIFKSSAFSILFVGDADPLNYRMAGELSQNIMDACIPSRLGVCAIGYLDNSKHLEDALGGRILHSLAIGSVTAEQITSHGYSEPVTSEISIKDYFNARLKGVLPPYMLPEFYVKLDKLPLTANGKIDRKALGGINVATEAQTVYLAPRTATEKKLAAIWAEVLKLEKVGVNDNFFNIGGDSLSVVRIAAKIKNVFGIESENIKSILENPTVAQLSVVLERELVNEETI